MSRTKILLIEDESFVRIGLEENLVLEGYEVCSCSDGLAGLETYEKENPDLVILDVMMPGLDGLEVCRKIRAAGRDTPVIMLTAKSAEIDKVVGLELGADDYLTKPFGMRELFARVKALLRRSMFNKDGAMVESKPREELSFDDVVIDFRAYRAKRGDQEIVLSAKEYELLRYFADRPDIVVSRDQLLDDVWGYNNYPTTRTVDNFIARLRQKVEQVPEKPRHLLTVHGVGYKFVA